MTETIEKSVNFEKHEKMLLSDPKSFILIPDNEQHPELTLLAGKLDKKNIRYLMPTEITKEIIDLYPELDIYPENCSLLAKQFILKLYADMGFRIITKKDIPHYIDFSYDESIFDESIFINIPFLREIPSCYFVEGFGSKIQLFNNLPEDFIKKEAYPYLNNHISWTFSSIMNFRLIYNKRNINYLFEMIFDDCLDYLKSLSISNRGKEIKIIEGFLIERSEISKVHPNFKDKFNLDLGLWLVDLFPELKLSMINL